MKKSGKEELPGLAAGYLNYMFIICKLDNQVKS